MTNSIIGDELALLGGLPIKKFSWPPTIIRAKETEKFLLQALHSGTWAIGSGLNESVSFERRFAERFARLVDAKYCIPTSSGTAALKLALLALNIRPGDKVVVPGLTWVACASSVLSVGAIPVLVDIDPRDLCLSLEETEKHLKSGCKAIMLVHLYNSSACSGDFFRLAERYNIPLIEDCAQSIGTKIGGRNVGSFGDVACFSFHQSKELAAGEGGAVTTNNKDLFDRVELLRSDGMICSDPGNKYYGNIVGHNMNMSEIHSAILCGQIEEFEKNLTIKEDSANYLKEILANEGFYTKRQNVNDTKTSYFKFIIEIDVDRFNHIPVHVITEALSHELKTLISPIYTPLNNNVLYKPRVYPAAYSESHFVDPGVYKLPNATWSSKRYIGLHHNILLGDKDDFDNIPMALLKLENNIDKLLEYKIQSEKIKRVADFNI